MKVYSIILNICLVISIGCLAAGYILGGYWQIMLIFLAMAFFWFFLKKRSAFWSASSLLLIYIFLAAIGVTVNLSFPLLVIGCITALASWDLTHFGQSVVDDQPFDTKVPLLRYRLQALATAVFTSLLLVFVSSYINLRFPFGVTALLVLMAIGCLFYGVKWIEKKS